MAVSGPGDHQLKRIVLPSGKTIEVVYFGQPDAFPLALERPDSRPGTVHHHGDDLHVCPDCESPLVYPVHWQDAGDAQWEIELRCPNCEWREIGVFDQPRCDRFDDELERGSETLTRDYKRLMTANLAEELERFKHALEVDAILPMDF